MLIGSPSFFLKLLSKPVVDLLILQSHRKDNLLHNLILSSIEPASLRLYSSDTLAVWFKVVVIGPIPEADVVLIFLGHANLVGIVH